MNARNNSISIMISSISSSCMRGGRFVFLNTPAILCKITANLNVASTCPTFPVIKVQEKARQHADLGISSIQHSKIDHSTPSLHMHVIQCVTLFHAVYDSTRGVAEQLGAIAAGCPS